MMIVGGSEAINARTLNVSGIPCKGCNEKDTLEIQTSTGYIHLLFIPFLSEGKISKLICTSCGKYYNVSMQSERIQELVRNEKKRIKIPLWHFSGAFGLVLLIIGFAGYSIWDDSYDDIYINDPKVGDVYEVRDEGIDEYYTLLKIDSVSKDSVYILQNMRSINKKHGLDDLDKTENFLPYQVGISRVDLKKMYENGEILEINR